MSSQSDADGVALTAYINRMVVEHKITTIIYRYCRGIDRRDFDLVRSCYHGDASEAHGDYQGGIEGFVARTRQSLARCERTMHFVGNVLIEMLDSDRARAESYTLAFHRLPERSGAPRDRVVGLRYVDVFTCRLSEWRIQARQTVCDWTRTDPIRPGWEFPDDWLRGSADLSDPVYR